jgi:PTH1 family peptidyl-tRNA hydrolase
MAAIRLIAGLGNPGPRYERTRHNVGAVFVERLAARFGVRLEGDVRFKTRIGRGLVLGHDLRLMIPTTYMNLSGEAVGSVAAFYKIAAEEIVVAYDEMAFEIGTVRLKIGGGHNGHNGIRDVIRSLGNNAGFARLRIGVGHPGDASLVSNYLTGVNMPTAEATRVAAALDLPDATLEHLLSGAMNKAMNALHAPPVAPPAPEKGTD